MSGFGHLVMVAGHFSLLSTAAGIHFIIIGANYLIYENYCKIMNNFAFVAIVGRTMYAVHQLLKNTATETKVRWVDSYSAPQAS